MININLNKAKDIGHNYRRFSRALEFSPHDDVIAKQIPGNAAATAEAARQAIREKYAVIQEKIDSANTPEEIKNTFVDFHPHIKELLDGYNK